jgi:hypothetical protein
MLAVMVPRPIPTIGDHLHVSYANLAMAHAAVTKGVSAYGALHYSIRAKLLRRLRAGEPAIRPLVDDEKLKLVLPQACAYCGARDHLAADHMVPRNRGGPDVGENLVWSCRSCNSKKGVLDMLAWYERRGEFPPLLLLRRWLKLALDLANAAGVMSAPLDAMHGLAIEVERAPQQYPAPATLRMWVVPL